MPDRATHDPTAAHRLGPAPEHEAVPALPRDVRGGLKRAALRLKEERSRGHVPLTFWVGTPGAEEDPRRTASFRTDPRRPEDGVDRDVRAHLGLTLAHLVLPAAPEPCFWVTRSGEPELCHPDAVWMSAVFSVCDDLGLPRWFAVVTRTGWLHQPSGAAQRWKRLRA